MSLRIRIVGKVEVEKDDAYIADQYEYAAVDGQLDEAVELLEEAIDSEGWAEDVALSDDGYFVDFGSLNLSIGDEFELPEGPEGRKAGPHPDDIDDRIPF